MLMELHEGKNIQSTIKSLLTCYATCLLAVFTEDLLKVVSIW